jgi:DNA-binding transcriptional ArsR family regulator
LSVSLPDPLSRTFMALADPTRRAILAQVADGALTVNDIVGAGSLSQPAISKHLKVLEEAGLIRRERVARTRPVHLDPEGLKRASDWIAHYRQHWEGAFDRMDALIERLQDAEKRNGRQ